MTKTKRVLKIDNNLNQIKTVVYDKCALGILDFEIKFKVRNMTHTN